MMAESDIGDLSSLNNELATLRNEHGRFSPLLLATIAKVGNLPLLFRKANPLSTHGIISVLLSSASLLEFYREMLLLLTLPSPFRSHFFKQILVRTDALSDQQSSIFTGFQIAKVMAESVC